MDESVKALVEKYLAIGEARGMERAAEIDDDLFPEAHLKIIGKAFAETIRQAITNPDQFVGADKLIHKQIACEFFRWWHNQPGSNTEQGFDDWWEKRREDER